MLIRTYTKYIIQQVNAYFFSVLFILIAMVWLTQSLRLIDLITNKGIDIFSFLKITAMLITPLSYIIIPIAMLISTIMLASKLSHDRELVVLRNAGLSNFQIAKPIIIYATLITILNYSISLYFLPKSYREYKDMQEVFKNKYLSLFLEEGVFNTQINNITVYIDEKLSDTEFKGIFIYDNRNSEKPSTIMADSGLIRRTTSGPEFVLNQGSQQEENKKTGNISLVFFDNYRFNLSLFTESSLIRSYDVNELFVHQLFKAENVSDSVKQEYLVNANQRVIWPIYTLVLAILALGMMLSGYYSRRNQLIKNVVTAGVCSLAIVLSLAFNNLALKNFAMTPLIYLNCLVFLGFGIAALRRHNSIGFIVWLEQAMQRGLSLRNFLRLRIGKS